MIFANLDEPSPAPVEKPLPKKLPAEQMGASKLRREEPLDLFRFDREADDDEETDEETGKSTRFSNVRTE